MKTQCRVIPLKSCEKNSSKYSLHKSLAHDLRMYTEAHIDKNLTKNNMFIFDDDKYFTIENILKNLEEIKEKYSMVTKKSTIDVANYIFTVNKEFFEENTEEKSREKKENFLEEVNNFLEKECGENSVLCVIGHDDEDGFHVHAYAVPLYKTLIKNKYKSEEKLLINYRGKYSHSKQELIEFREKKLSDKTKTGELQTRWAEHIQQIFPQLERGKRQSEKRHITPKEFRENIQEKSIEIEKKNEELQRKNEYFEHVISTHLQTIKEQEKKLQEMEEKQKIIEKEIKENQEKNQILEEKSIKIDMEIKEKERKNAEYFRTITAQEIAKQMGRKSCPTTVKVKGKTRKISNAIDYLMYVEKLSFAASLEYLSKNFTQSETMKTIEETLEKSQILMKEKPYSLQVKEEIIRKQFEALRQPFVRLTAQKNVLQEDGTYKKVAINLSKDQEGKEFFSTAEDVMKRIPELNKLNMEGWNIYITPIEYELQKEIPIFIDDVTEKTLQEIKKNIGEPNLVLESSPGNYQVVFLMKNEINYEQGKKKIESERQKYNEIFKALNSLYGDKTISGLRHPFRLAGYTNQKPNREARFVKIIEHNPEARHSLEALLNDLRERETPAVEKNHPLTVSSVLEGTSTPKQPSREIEPKDRLNRNPGLHL